MSKKILLVAPAYQEERIQLNLDFIKFPRLGLGVIAALTPDDYEITLIDETNQDITPLLDKGFDLVGITSLTYTAPRAYELATQFRERGSTIIMGGVHATFLPEEALQYVDSVVRQEGELAWPELLKDFERRKLKKVYEGGSVPLEKMVNARREGLFKGSRVFNFAPIQTTRGCPYRCEYCSVVSFNENYRQRPIEDVLDEIEQIENHFLLLVDDNLIGSSKSDRERVKNLFRGMIERGFNKKWISQVTVNVADDEELLKLARKSGAFTFLIGFESILPETIREMNKGFNLRSATDGYKNVINKLHDYGIAVIADIMFGNDHDTPEVFDATIEWVLESKVDVSQYFITTPFPGTRLYDRIKSEDRLFRTNYPSDWKYYAWSHPTFYPKQMTVEQLEEGFRRAYKTTNSLRASLRRMVNTAIMSRGYTTPVLSFLANYSEGRHFK